MGARQRLPVGYLAWAASGKDPGFGPSAILEAAARCRYSAEEVARLAYEGRPPDAARLSREWRGMLDRAKSVVSLLPPEEVGTCVLDAQGLFRGRPEEIASKVSGLAFHRGRIGGALPRLK